MLVDSLLSSPGATESVRCCLLCSVRGAECIMAALPLSVGKKLNVSLMKLSPLRQGELEVHLEQTACYQTRLHFLP